MARADELQRELSDRVVNDKLSGVSEKAQEGGSEPVNSQMANTAAIIGAPPNVESPDVVATETTLLLPARAPRFRLRSTLSILAFRKLLPGQVDLSRRLRFLPKKRQDF